MSTESEKSPSSMATTVIGLAKPFIQGIVTLLPMLIVQVSNLYKMFKKLPQNILVLIYGFVICFFGGSFPVLFAALQAAEHGGRRTLMLAVEDLASEALTILKESKKDDNADMNNNGVKDVDEMSSAEYLRRKTQLVLQKTNPEKVDKAVGAIYRVWLSVAAVLSIQFARTITLALSIEEFLRKPLGRVEPSLVSATSPEYRKWVPVVLSWIRKAIAVSVAWFIQSIITAFTSSLQGGLLMARAIYDLCLEHKIGGLPKNHSESFLDEGLSYVLAGLGFYFQFSLGFSLPFPLNLVLSPFKALDYYIRWSVTSRPIP